MLPQEIIRKKRDKRPLEPAEIAEFVTGVVSGAVSEGQVAAMTMAILLNGMSRDEAVALTLAMRDSGDVLDWSDLPGPVTDKHSTGGVGDNVSLMLAPIVAACGAYVPMISGRGLGHTGGTLDKMDSIPGYASQPDNALFRKAVLEAGQRAEARGWKAARDKTEELTATLAKHGMIVQPMPPELAKEMKAIGDTMVGEWQQKAGADGKAVLDAYRN